jgi:hypothetical protein
MKFETYFEVYLFCINFVNNFDLNHALLIILYIGFYKILLCHERYEHIGKRIKDLF